MLILFPFQLLHVEQAGVVDVGFMPVVDLVVDVARAVVGVAEAVVNFTSFGLII